MLYRLSTIIIFFYVNFFVKHRRKETNISVLLELLTILWYNISISFLIQRHQIWLIKITTSFRS